MNPNNTSFPLKLETQMKRLKKDYEKKEHFLRLHQWITKNYFMDTPRGMLVCYGTGFGKTYFAAAASEELAGEHDVIVMSAKSLASNFIDTIYDYLTKIQKKSHNEAKEIIDRRYRFVSSNASNSFKQIEKIDETYENRIKSLSRTSLEDKVLVYDEAHEFFRGIVNGGKNAIALYDLIMKTRNIKLMFLSATPITNNLFEIAPCMNMLFGRRFFPEFVDDFNSWFIADERISHKKQLGEYMLGKISYYGDIWVGSNKEGFPEEILDVIKVPMGQYQYGLYSTARAKERKEEERRYSKQSSERFGQDKSSSSSYRVKSRQYSNYALPIDQIERKKKKLWTLGDINEEQLEHVKNYSTKMKKMLDMLSADLDLKTGEGCKSIVYSTFVAAEGIGIFAKLLEHNGWKEFKAGDKKQKQKNTFALFTGSVSSEEREEILSIFNSKENDHGEIIRTLMISGAGATGIDTKTVREVYIMEPYWNYSQIKQIKARAIRYMSHSSLPEEERNVHVYVFLSDFPVGNKDDKDPYTTDENIWKNSLTKQKLIDEFMILLANASVDCSLYGQDCIRCEPTDKYIYPKMDMRELIGMNISFCKKYTPKNQTIDAHELIINDEIKVYYTKDDSKDDPLEMYQIFQYNESLDSYMPMLPSNPLYQVVMEKLIFGEE